MKQFLLSAALIGSMGALLGGCTVERDWGATPAYSSRERNQQIDRNIDYEGKQIIDDFDHLLLLRPAGHMTIWNVR